MRSMKPGGMRGVRGDENSSQILGQGLLPLFTPNEVMSVSDCNKTSRSVLSRITYMMCQEATPANIQPNLSPPCLFRCERVQGPRRSPVYYNSNTFKKKSEKIEQFRQMIQSIPVWACSIQCNRCPDHEIHTARQVYHYLLYYDIRS